MHTAENRDSAQRSGRGEDETGLITYEDIQIRCIRTLGITDLDEISRMTLKEYQLRMKAAAYQQLDRMYEIHALAWAINQAGAKRKSGRPVFRTFRSFFDYEKLERKIRYRSGDNKPSGMLYKVAEYMSKRKNQKNRGDA